VLAAPLGLLNNGLAGGIAVPNRSHTQLLSAVHFAADKHRYQRRKDEVSSPYINHPISVAEILASVGRVTDLAVLQAAILHDTLEDTETTRQELVARFGAKVAALVAEVTDDKRLPKQRRKQLQVEHAPHLSRGAKLVKLGDKICNLIDVTSSPPSKWSEERQLGYIDWSRRVVEGCRDASPALASHFDRIAARAGRVVRARFAGSKELGR
jgi:GTP diphosphokinase / guanosine-3',5'-bis(diphosphate) 3'-diphosphatase